jgi:hypothetical protein
MPEPLLPLLPPLLALPLLPLLALPPELLPVLVASELASGIPAPFEPPHPRKLMLCAHRTAPARPAAASHRSTFMCPPVPRGPDQQTALYRPSAMWGRVARSGRAVLHCAGDRTRDG